MLDLNASAFLGAATNLARLHQIFSGLGADQSLLIPSSVELISNHVSAFRDEAEKLGARLSVVAANRFMEAINREPCTITVQQAVITLDDIESRFADYLTEVRMFVLYQQESSLFEPADVLIEIDGFAAAFPSAAFEVEEAAKCVALGRYTAAVFHAMRMLEVGIRSLAKRLNIPDPTKPAEKNWGVILKCIKEKIDELWPGRSNLSSSEGAAFEKLYASLDAVRNPWRNATMHVETIYAPHEALHIIRCSAYFMRQLSELCDESGLPPLEPEIKGLIG